MNLAGEKKGAEWRRSWARVRSFREKPCLNLQRHDRGQKIKLSDLMGVDAPRAEQTSKTWKISSTNFETWQSSPSTVEVPQTPSPFHRLWIAAVRGSMLYRMVHHFRVVNTETFCSQSC
ncbi:hypothetical protein VTO42DRAFT_1067 [Malbranchea cinnamomea]